MFKKLIISFGIVGLLFACPIFFVSAMTPDSDTTYKGIDISSYEPNFDFSLASQQGIKIVYLRTSLGMNDKDSSFKRHLSEANKNGVLVGGYHFLYLGGIWGVENNLANALSAVQGATFDCKYVIDFEQEGLVDASLSKEEITSDVLQFADEFTKQTGIPCMLYTSTYFIKEHFTNNITKLPIWIADYRIPQGGGLDENTIYSKWAGFQYADDIGCSNSPAIDADYFSKSVILDGKTVIDAPVQTKPIQTVSQTYSIVKYGDTGESVVSLQSKLNKFGYGLSVDGQFGRLTENAVLDFQKKHNLQIDGIVGNQTWNTLDSISVTSNMSNGYVLQAQKYLNSIGVTDSNGNKLDEDGVIGNCTISALRKHKIQNGSNDPTVALLQYKLGGLDVDSFFGGYTESEVRSWQSNNGLSSDGIVGYNSWYKLLS